MSQIAMSLESNGLAHLPFFTGQGRWSVTRPGIFLLAKVDGSLDVWDFTDTSYRFVRRRPFYCYSWLLATTQTHPCGDRCVLLDAGLL